MKSIISQNERFLESVAVLFDQFVGCNIESFINDTYYATTEIQNFAERFGEGLKKSGDEELIINASYSYILIKGLFGTGLAHPIKKETWKSWVRKGMNGIILYNMEVL